MTTKNSSSFVQFICRSNGANLNLFRYVAMAVVLFTLGIGNAWAGGGTTYYYTKGSVSVKTGSGTVYINTASPATSGNSTTSSTAATKSCDKTSTQNQEQTYYISAVPATDWRFDSWTLSNWSTNPSSSTATTSGKIKAASSTESSPSTATAQATFKQISIASANKTSVTLDPTDARTSCSDYTGSVVFTTTNDNAAAQIGTPTFGSTSGSGTWTASNSWAAGTSTVTYTFKGNGYYGGSGTSSGSRSNSATLTLPTAGGTSSKSVTFTANFPSLVLSDATENNKAYPINPTTDGTGTVVFPVQYCDGAFDFTATITGASGGTFTPGTISFTQTDAATGSGNITVPFTFNAGGAEGDFSATLTLTPQANTGGTAKSVTITAYAEAEATNDVSVTTAAGVTTEYATFAAGLTAANASAGCTLKLLRNIDLGTITATNNISKAMTIDLNGKELRAAVNAKQVGVLTINANVAVTIKDSKTGGRIINEYGKNDVLYTINVAKGTLNLESGTISIHNTLQQSYGTAAAGGVATSVVAMGARAIQQAAATTVNINGGRVESYGTRAVYGIRTEGSKANNTTLNISGGEIYAESPAYVYAVFSNGKLNVSGGTITAKINNEVVNENTAYMEYIRTNNKLWDNRTYGLRGFGYGILLQGGNSVTANANYFGTLNMTGGTVNVINVGDPETQANSTAASVIQSPLYGVYFNAAALNVKSGTASDGSYSQKYAAKGSITGGTVNVTNNGRQSYGVWVTGNYNSFDNSYAPVELKNCTINVSSYYESYGVYATAVVGTTSDNASPNMGACYAGEVELTGATVTAETTTAATAYALFAHAVVGNVYKNATWTKAKNAGYPRVYDGEFGAAAKITVNSGTYTATSATTTAYAVGSTTRAKTTLSSETSVAANRELGGNAEAYPVLVLHGGTFRGETGTTTSGAVLSGGYTTIDGGTYTAYSGSTTSRGIYATAGTLDVSNVEISASGTTTAYGIDLSCGISDYTGFKYYADATLKNLTVTATTRTGGEADAVLMEVTKRPLSTTTYNALSSTNKTNYGAIYQYGEYAVGSKCTIIGGIYTATSATATAYGVRMNSAAICEDVNGDGELAIGAAELTVKNATFTVKANNGKTAYGVWAGGPATIDNSKFTVNTSADEAWGIRARYGKTTINNSTINVTAGTATARGIYVDALMSAISTSNSTTHFCGVQGFEITGELESNNNTITAKANGGNTAYAIQVIDAKGSATQTTAEKGLAFAGDHACAGKATINGGKYTATASGTTAYAIVVSDPAAQGEVTATPECIVNDGKFYGYATGGTYADVSLAGETGYFVLNGGYYVKDENLDKKLGEGMNKVAVKSGTPEYTEGYRWRITDNMNGEYVCKIKENSTSYQSLEEALQVVNASPSSTWTIIMIANATLSKGDYNLPQNTTLLIPYLTSQTAIIGTGGKSTSPVSNVEKYEAPYPLYKLTFADGVNMTVHGTIEASAVTYMSNQGLLTHGTGVVSGSYGWLYLAEGSHIDLESTAKLIAWGFVTGKGEINAKSGSKIYEDFQIGDWRGGTVESDVIDNKNGLDSKSVFVITHYYYQNIECPITYRPGATAYGWGGTYMYNNSLFTIEETVPLTEPVAMVGTSDAMFCMSSATSGDDTWVRKEYDPETDYVNWTLNSGASLGSIRIQLDLPIVGKMDVNSSNYVLPITSNFNIVANYGEVALTNHVCFIPGSKLTIKKEATVIIPSGQRAFFYDQDDWSSYSGYWFCPGYSPSWKKNPRLVLGAVTAVKMPDAEVLIEGTLDIRGAAYTTAGGANIHSTRENAGKVKFTAAPAASTAAVASNTNKNQSTTLFQFTGNGPNYTGKALNPAKLKNEDGTYSEPTSSNTSAGKTWIYMADFGGSDVYKWTLATENGCMTTVAADATKDYIHPSDWVPVGAVNSNHAYPSEDGTRMFVNAIAPTTNTGCVWWEVNPTPEVIGGTTYYIANNENFDNYGTYYYWDNSTSYWKPKKVTVIWKDKDGNKITNGSFGDLYNFNTSPVFHGTNPSWANSATEKHDWIGWRDEEGNIYDKNATLPLATADVTTYIAYFVTSPFQYTITFKNKTTGEGGDGKVIWSGLMNASDTDPAVCPVTPTQDMTADKVYTFSNWVGYAAGADLPNVTGPATYTAHYTTSTRQYHVTFYNYDAATVLFETDVDYNTRPVYGGVTPFRSNTSAYSYEWTGWQQGATHYGTTDNLALVTGDVYYVATFSQTDLKYQVLFKRQDGSIIDAPFFNFEETPTAFPANPTLASTVSTDYTFDHWDPATLQPVTVDGMVYTAHFSESPRQYTAHFVNYDGTSLGVDQTIDYNTVPAYTGVTPMKPNDSRNSYEFSGWAWAAGDGWEAGSIGIGEAFPAIKGDITFTAQYNPVLLQFNVIYKRPDGTFIKQDKVKWGQNTTAPVAEECNYEDAQYTYTFSAWSPATIVNPVAADAVYTAVYTTTPRSYSVTLNTNEGTINAGNVTSYTYGTGATLPTNVTRTGYDFSGWYDNSDLEGSAVTNISTTATGNKTYWAKWTIHTHALTWNFNGGTPSGSYTAADNAIAYGTAIEYPTLTRTGYTFNGWSSSATSMPDEDLTITANWSAVTYNLTYEGLNGATNSNPATYTVESETITLAAPGTRGGYNFDGWTFDGSPITQIALGSTGDKTITANWTAVTYNLTYEGLNGASNSNPATYTVETATFTLAAPGTRTGYNFIGWTCGGSPITQIALGSTGDKTITANWEQTGVTILWNSEDGKTTLETDNNVAIGDTPSYDRETPTKATTEAYTYTFDGWATEANGAGTFYAIGELPPVSAATTFYAHFTATANVASVKVGSETTYYTNFADAWEAVNSASGTVTLKLLQDVEGIATSLAYTNAQNCTFDLNNHTLSGTVTKLIDVNTSGKTFTIDDSSDDKGGMISMVGSGNSRFTAVYITAGKVNLKQGKVYSKNTGTYNSSSAKYVAAAGVETANGGNFTMDDGTIESESQYKSYALFINKGTSSVVEINGGLIKGHTNKGTTACGIYNSSTKLTINNGHIVGHAWTNTSYGLYNYYGKATINGGIIEATNDTINGKGTTKAYGISTAYSSSTYTGAITIPSTSTVKVYARTNTTTAYAVVIGGNSTGSTIEGGTFTAKAGTTTAQGINSAGKITVSGGTFHVSAASTSSTITTWPCGIYATRGTVTVNGNPTFNVTSGASRAYGAFAYGTIDDKGTGKYSGTIKINGGTFNVTTTTTTAYGVYAGLLSKTVAEAEGNVAGTHYMPGIIEITDGTFNVTATTNTAYGIVVKAQQSETIGDVTTDRIPKVTVTGGKFNVVSTNDASKAYAVGTSATNTALDIQGGWYNINTNLSGYVAPTKECNYYVLPLTDEDPYNYEVAEAYNVTFNANEHGEAPDPQLIKKNEKATEPDAPTEEGYTFGGWYKEAGCTNEWNFASDVVTSAQTLYAKWTASATGFYVDIVDVDNDAKTLTLNVTGWASNGWPYNVNVPSYEKGARQADRTLIIPYTGNAGDAFPITVKKTGGDIVSMHTYIIPQEITFNTDLSTLPADQMIYVKNGATLTVNADKTEKNIYVAPGAKLVVNSGVTLEADTVFLRTTPWESAELELNGTITGKVCYTRIISKKDQYYQFGLPMPCPIESVTLSDGSKPVYGNGWLLRSYSEYNRAMNGTSAEADNWVTLTNVGDDNTIQGRVGYEMFSNSGYYREYYFPVAHTGLATSVSVTRTTEGKDGKSTKGADHEGWNIICSPLMSAATIEPVPEGMKVSWLQADGSYWQRSVTEIKPAIPFSYQATANGSISFAQSIAAPALRRVAATEEPVRIQWMQLDILNATGLCDQTEIYSHPARYEQRYQTGIDVAKQSFSASRALIYSSHVYGDMAFAGVADSLLERGVALTVYCPSAQELTISMRENDWLDRMAQVWLVDHETGARTDLLASDYTFDAAAGTTAGRFTIEGVFRAPQVTTDVDNGQWTMDNGQGTKAKKLILRDKMYILVGDTLYDATGRLVK